MAWASLSVLASGDVLTHTHMNQIRLNLLETSAATVTTAGDIVYADGANSMARLAIGDDFDYLQVSSGVPDWVDSRTRKTGDRSTTGSVSTVGSQKATATLNIPSSWSTGWTCQATGVARFIWNGTATSGDMELYVAGSAFSPGTEQDLVSTSVTGPVTVIGNDNALTSTGVVTVGLYLVANGTADYADAWITAQGFLDT